MQEEFLLRMLLTYYLGREEGHGERFTGCTIVLNASGITLIPTIHYTDGTIKTFPNLPKTLAGPLVEYDKEKQALKLHFLSGVVYVYRDQSVWKKLIGESKVEQEYNEWVQFYLDSKDKLLEDCRRLIKTLELL